MSYPDYTSLPQYASILHLWKLDEESGTRSDFIATCHLTDNNTVLYGTGKIGNAADFELATSEYLSATAASSSDMNFTTGNFSISFWVKPESTTSHHRFAKRGYDSSDGWDIFFVYTVDQIYFRVNQSGASQDTISNTNLYNDGTLCHITIVRDGTTGYIYVNGSDETLTQPTLTNPVASSYSLYIGVGNPPTASYLDGILDELIVWNVALSPAEVSTLYSWYSKAGFSGAITFVGTLQKLPKKLLTGAISFTGTLLSIKNKIDDVWKFIVKRTTTWTGQDKETTTWTAQDKEDTDWTTT